MFVKVARVRRMGQNWGRFKAANQVEYEVGLRGLKDLEGSPRGGVEAVALEYITGRDSFLLQPKQS